MVSIDHIESVSMAPTVQDETLQKRVTYPVKYSFCIRGVSTAFANGIRRALAVEMKGKILHFDASNFKTSDPHLLSDLIGNRINSIVIKQTISASATYSLAVYNDGLTAKDVRMHSVMPKTKSEPIFNANTLLCTLEPGHYLRIDPIVVTEGFGYDNALYSGVCQAVCLPLDVKPINLYLPADDPDRGVHSSVSDAREHMIRFVSVGGAPPAILVREACESLHKRITSVKSLIARMPTADNMYMLTVPGESDTIGNMLMKTVCELCPTISLCTYETHDTRREIIVKVKSASEDVPDLLSRACDNIRETLNVIVKYFK